jgi:hypothetical protein
VRDAIPLSRERLATRGIEARATLALAFSGAHSREISPDPAETTVQAAAAPISHV